MQNNDNVILEEKPQTNAPEYDFDQREMMRYRVNGFSYKFGLFGMIFSMLGAFICLNSMNPADAQVIFIILLNVVILLGGFLACEKVKAYNKGGAIAQLVFGAICVARIFYIPLILIINYSRYLSSVNITEVDGVTQIEKIEGMEDVYSNAKNNLGATITSKYEGSVANSFLPASGYFRGISAMVLFGLAAACFIVAGVVGYKKAKELEGYLDSIKKD